MGNATSPSNCITQTGDKLETLVVRGSLLSWHRNLSKIAQVSSCKPRFWRLPALLDKATHFQKRQNQTSKVKPEALFALEHRNQPPEMKSYLVPLTGWIPVFALLPDFPPHRLASEESSCGHMKGFSHPCMAPAFNAAQKSAPLLDPFLLDQSSALSLQHGALMYREKIWKRRHLGF